MVQVFATMPKNTRGADEQIVTVTISGEDALNCFDLDRIAGDLCDQLQLEFKVECKGNGEYIDSGFENIHATGTVTFEIDVNHEGKAKMLKAKASSKARTEKQTTARNKKVSSSIDLRDAISNIFQTDAEDCFCNLIDNELKKQGWNVTTHAGYISSYECDGRVHFTYSYEDTSTIFRVKKLALSLKENHALTKNNKIEYFVRAYARYEHETFGKFEQKEENDHIRNRYSLNKIKVLFVMPEIAKRDFNFDYVLGLTKEQCDLPDLIDIVNNTRFSKDHIFPMSMIKEKLIEFEHDAPWDDKIEIIPISY